MHKYLKTLTLINIQAHRETILELVPGLNVIKGTSHTGKSSIARGIDWWLNNRPLAPQNKIKHWSAKDSEEMAVIGEFSDGSYVIRTHSKDFNGYLVGDSDGVEEPYEALRTEVPEEVRLAMGLNDMNYRGQDDGYFMLSDSPGEVARKFNQAAGLDAIDAVTSKIKELDNFNKKEIKVTESKIKDATKGRDQLLFVRELYSQMDILGRKVTRIRTIDTNLSLLSKSLKEIDTLRVTLSRLQNKVKYKKSVQKVRNLLEQHRETQTKFDQISVVVKNLSSYRNTVKEDKEWLKIKPLASALRNKIGSYEKLTAERDELLNTCNTIESSRSKARTLSLKVSEAKALCNTLRKKLDYCQYCGAHKDHWNENR